MRALAIVHQPDAGPGIFADPFAEESGWELVPWMIAEERRPPVDPDACDAVMTFGGAMHADQVHAHPWLADEKRLLAGLLARGVPLLGVCLGAQLLAAAAGTEPHRAAEPEIGWFDVELTTEGSRDPLLAPLAPRLHAFEWHSYEIPLPASGTALARSERVLQAYRIGDRAWGIQFHAEVSAHDVDAWILGYHSDEDAVALGLDWPALREQTRARIDAWNDVGRGICERFLTAAAA
jgi:GMP synthase-like glutamine amidotransferase